MKKERCRNHSCWKTLMRVQMPMMLFLVCLGNSGLRADTLVEKTRLHISVKNASVLQIFSLIKEQTPFNFVYNDRDISRVGLKSIDLKDTDIETVLNKCIEGTDLTYQFMGNVVVFRRRTEVVRDSVKEIMIRGMVRDEQGKPLPGVTVQLKDMKLGTATDHEGRYVLHFVDPRTPVVLIFSFIGMETVEVKYTGQPVIEVTMKENKVVLEDVVVTGYMNINKSSFTGAFTRVKRDELLKVSTGNVIDALQVFDPSLRMIKNNLMGSDPNTLPEFYVRGRSSFDGVKQLDRLESEDVSQYALTNNPNTPVFILDGYEVSVEKVYDLDLNRIESITILKDAAATAIYGSRASNGVIVIETVPPLPGKLRATYNFTAAITAPDLSDYNLMNAKEKLEAEVAAGLLDEKDPINPDSYETFASRLEDYRLKESYILRGVNTYWLSKPLQTEFNHKHSLYIDGGVESVRFGVGLRYEGQNGVMKESFRNRYGGSFKLDYRLNGLQIVNEVELNMMRSQNSSYGVFSDYTKMQPYFSPTDFETGKYTKIFYATYQNDIIYNPLYEAQMGNFDRGNYKEYTDNLSLHWYFLRNFQLKAQFAISYKDERTKKFTDPNSTLYQVYSRYSGTDSEKGDLYKTRRENFGWNTNVLLMYNNRVNRHNMNFTLGFNAKEDKINYSNSHFRGFPSAQLHEQKYAKEIVDMPSLQDNHTRLIGAFLAMNYTYNDIYLADVSLRFDGSSQFGSEQRFAPFWSFGLGVNFHNYEFLKEVSWLSQARVKANFGQTGKVDFPPYAARNTYDILLDDWHTTGIGGVLTYMGNDRLKWEKNNTWNIGLDVTFLKRFSVEFSWYDKRTVDLITDVTLPSSSGFTVYKDNLGEVLNRGYEINLNLALLQKKDWDLNVFARAAHNQNKILKISNSLKAYNDRVDEYYCGYWNYLSISDERNQKYASPVMKYTEGGSMTSIFGMRSLGIAPANGKELFLDRNGQVTYEWNSADQVIIGDEEPELQGSFGMNLRYKGFTLYTTFLFELGGDLYNQTLVNQVENANLWKRNVDKRVMSERWQKPGDITPLKSIRDRYQVTRSTSRFVQENNTLTFNSLTLGYDFNSDLVRRIGLSMLRLQFNMKDVAVFSSIKQERGLSYPFARTFNFTLNLSL